jgi:hypothetical protein
MPEIMRQFGQTIVVAAGGALIMALLFVLWPSGSGNVLNDVGSRASGQLAERPVTGEGTKTFSDHSGRSVPKAAVKGPAVQNVAFTLVDQFTLTDADGAVWSQANRGFMLGGTNRGGLVQVESITSSDGTEHVGGLSGSYSTDKVVFSQTTGIVTFLQPDIYRVRLRVLDYDNVEATYTIPLVVDFKP